MDGGKKLNAESTADPNGLSRVAAEIFRQCVACRTMQLRGKLLRIVHDRQQGAVFLLTPSSNRQIAAGRSAYLCLREDCLRIAIKGKKIQKALKTSIPDAILICLSDILKGIDKSGHSQS